MKTWVVTNPRYGNYSTTLEGSALASAVSAGAGMGAFAGSILPGIGTSVGGAIGAAGGAVASFLGYGKMPVKDILRQYYAESFASIMPDRLEMMGGKTPILSGEYRKADIMKIVSELNRRLIGQLKSGSDAYKDISRAVGGVRTVTQKAEPTDWHVLLIFNEARAVNYGNVSTDGGSIPESGSDGISDGISGSTDYAASATGSVVEGGRLFGLPPVTVAAILATAAVVFVSR